LSDVNLTITDRAGTDHAIVAATGDSLMQILREHVDITLGTCGGEISCGTCLVRLSDAWQAAIAPAGEDEAEMLDALGAGEGERLSCQIVLDAGADGKQATIAPEA
jgi:ferredoxin, 2Fe-2S